MCQSIGGQSRDCDRWRFGYRGPTAARLVMAGAKVVSTDMQEALGQSVAYEAGTLFMVWSLLT